MKIPARKFEQLRAPYTACIPPVRTIQPQVVRIGLYVSVLLAILTLGNALVAVTQQKQSSPQRIIILVTRVGSQSIPDNATLPEAAGNGCSPYIPVNMREEVSGTIDGKYPQGLGLYALLRRGKENEWKVDPNHLQALNPEWSVPLQIGTESDEGELFELQFVLTRDPLSAGPLPEGVLNRSAVARSPVLHLRRNAIASIWITQVNHQAVQGDEQHSSHTLAPVQFASRHVPSHALSGVAVQPLAPEWTRTYWVMDDSVAGGDGIITTHFGDPLRHISYEYQVVAFAACPQDFPPPVRRGVEISFQEWEHYREKFIALSTPVRVTKFEDQFVISKVDDNPVLSRRIRVGEYANIYGFAHRSLSMGEQIWVVCLPLAGDPWIAGSTDKLVSGGQWQVRGAAVWKEGRGASFRIIAAISSDDPGKKPPNALLDWINHAEQTINSVNATAVK